MPRSLDYRFEQFLREHGDIKKHGKAEYNGIVSLETYEMSDALIVEKAIGMVTRTIGTYHKITGKLRDIEGTSHKEMSQHASEKRKNNVLDAELRESKRGRAHHGAGSQSPDLHRRRQPCQDIQSIHRRAAGARRQNSSKRHHRRV